MTAAEYREYTLICDEPGCGTAYGPFGVERPRAELRRLAGKVGWSHVRSPHGRKYDDDFCAAHKPSAEAGR